MANPLVQPTQTIHESIMAVYEQLPPGERRLADITLSKLSNLASYSATELAGEATVSKATAARFFRRVGYSSFGHARRQARAEAHLASPLYAMAGVDPGEQHSDALSRHVAADLKNLSETYQCQDAKLLTQSAALIASARKVHVIGMRNGHFVAQYATTLLTQLREGVAALPMSATTLAEDLASLDSRDVVLVIDFRRRAATLPGIVQAARSTGASLIFLTNPGMPALSRPGDIVLHCLTDGASIFDSYVAAVSVVNFIGASTAKTLGKNSRKRLESIEAFHDLLGDIRVPS